ncbi:hypothetical protein Poli38472_002304 [Pythium oligandrum]|uniref:Guanine nucleotide-binding protein subunit beta-like protein n=1 Tax=Pythium oligandrum TaxID=41045 RepID=A0A8K1CI25_PYTOL|nr:hypothetical protein Poli38472_002304 [Pythium oligandrum]|eukprot:TMW63363.1 hypothetical protein Poli38472_002304 [Pythium oligandrum]
MDGEVDDENAQGMGVATPSGEVKEAYQHLRPWYALGTRPNGRQVVGFLSENVVVYPVGHHLTLFHVETRAMEFLYPTSNVRSVQSFHISANREYIAVAEIQHSGPTGASSGLASTGKHGATSGISTQQQEQHVIAIYRASTRNRIKTIALPHNSSVVACAFSSDNKFMAMLEDAPAHNVSYWKVNTGKLIASCKCPSRGTRININPYNPNYISVSGPMILKYWLWTNNDFRIGNFLPQTREQEHFVDHLWLKEYMIAVSERGMLLCFLSTSDYNGVDLIHASRCHQPSYVRLECLAPHSKGFVLGGSAGFFSVYENSDDPKDPFAFVRTVSVGDVAFECITISSNMDSIVACTKSQELISFSMSSIDTVQEDRIEYRELLQHGSQLGTVLQVDVCIQRSVVATCGLDKTVRVWNYELQVYEVMHQCPEEPVAIALHPTGYQIVVAFKERVRLFQVFQDSMRQTREIPIKSCRAVRFSYGGHMFACAAGLTVSVFKSYTCEPVHTFAGHIGAVRTVAWTRNDYYLYSAGQDGTVYLWDICKGSRCEEVQHSVKQCQYSAIAADENDLKLAFAAGSDGKIRPLVGSEDSKIVELSHGVSITALALTKDRSRLFAGTNSGSILVVRLPFTSKSVAYEYFAHAEAITKLRITDDNEVVVASSEDGCVSIFQVLNDAAASQKHHVDTTDSFPREYSKSTDRRKGIFALTDAVLVAREDVEEQKATVLEWQQKYDQLKADVEFTLHSKENEWIDRLRVLTEESESIMVQERKRYEELEHRHQLAQRKHAGEMSHKEASHVKMTQELENQYERKLAQEMARYDALSETLEQTRQRCEALVEAQDVQHRNTLHAERKTAYARSKEQNDVIKRLHDDLKYNHSKFEEVLHQEESDYEQELQLVRASYEKQLDLERQNTAIKQGQLSATNTKLESTKKKVQELKATLHAQNILLSTERAKLTKLEATMTQYEKHFDVCKFSISDKDKEIVELKSSNRVLENFRSVLHHRIDNLEAAKSPMQEHMTALETHIHDMQTELADEYQLKAANEQELETKEAKVKMLLHEVKSLRQNMLKKEYTMSEMVREFTRMAQMTNWKDAEAAIKDAYKVFAIGETVHRKNRRAVLAATASEERPSSPSKEKSNSKLFTAPGSPAGKPQTRDSKAAIAMSPKPRPQVPPSPAKPPQGSSNQTSLASTDEALGYDCKQAVDESVKQMEYMSKTIMTLQTALDNTKAKADRIRRDAISEGSLLIEECNKLRKESKLQQMRIRELEHQVSTHRRDGKTSPNHQLASNASSPQLAPYSPVEPTNSLSVGNSTKLAALVCGTPSKTSRVGSPASPATSRRSTPLPFARLELERQRRSAGSTTVDELSSVVAEQKKEIQRLQMQVRLLLSDEDPGSSRKTSEGGPEQTSTTNPVDPPPSRGHNLRPILPANSSSPQPLHSSFVLTPVDR